MTISQYLGKWRIYEMQTWDKDYFDMECKAYIKIEKNKNGEFQFGLVHGYFHGKIVSCGGVKRFEFTWEGNDECEEAFGFGWIKLKTKNVIEGEFRIHNGDDSTFLARKILV